MKRLEDDNMIKFADEVNEMPNKSGEQVSLFKEQEVKPVSAAVKNGAELATAGNDIIYKYGVSAENPDTLIATKGMDYLSKIEEDTHVASQLATRRQKLIKKGWAIKPFTKNGKVTARAQEIADFVKDQLIGMRGSFEKDIEAMLDAIGKGFSITEKNYRYLSRGRWAGKTGLASLRFKPAKYFSFKFDKYGHYSLRQIDPDPSGVELDLNKFIHLIAGPNDENPYGAGLTSKCAFWVWLKENEAKFWAIYSERFGMPLVQVELPATAQAGDKDTLKAQQLIEQIQTTSGIAVPKNFKVSFLEAVRNGNVDYEKFIELCNKEISKVILGQTLATEEGKRGGGSYAMGQNHSDIMEDYILFDAAATSAAINEQLIRQLVDINWSTEEYPVFEWVGARVGSLISFAQSVSQLVASGVNTIPVAWVHEQTGIPIAKEGEPVMQVVGGGPFGSAQGEGVVGQDNNGKGAFSGPIFGKDAINRVSTFGVDVSQFADDIDEMDGLHNRYVALISKKYETLQKKIAASLKKKD